jgi:hypothetical protein
MGDHRQRIDISSTRADETPYIPNVINEGGRVNVFLDEIAGSLKEIN